MNIIRSLLSISQEQHLNTTYVTSETTYGIYLTSIYKEGVILPYSLLVSSLEDRTILRTYYGNNIPVVFGCPLCNLTAKNSIIYLRTDVFTSVPQIEVRKDASFNYFCTRYLDEGYPCVYISPLRHLPSYDIISTVERLTYIYNLLDNNSVIHIPGTEFIFDSQHSVLIYTQKIPGIILRIKSGGSIANGVIPIESGVVKGMLFTFQRIEDIFESLNRYINHLINTERLYDLTEFISHVSMSLFTTGSDVAGTKRYCAIVYKGNKDATHLINYEDKEYRFSLTYYNNIVNIDSYIDTITTEDKLDEFLCDLSVIYGSRYNDQVYGVGGIIEPSRYVTNVSFLRQGNIEGIKTIIRNTNLSGISKEYDINLIFTFLSIAFDDSIFMNPSILSAAVKVGTNNMFDLNVNNNTFLRGNTVNIIKLGGIMSLLNMTKGEGSDNNIPIQRRDINTWFNIIRKIGEVSVMGSVFEVGVSNLTNRTDFNITIKTPQVTMKPRGSTPQDIYNNKRRVAYLELIHEYKVGMNLNSMRQFVPSFMMTYGMFSCGSDPQNMQICTGGMSMPFLVIEYIRGNSLKKHIKVSSIDVVYNSMVQILFASEIAFRKIGFHHYDMHMGNILTYDTSLPEGTIFSYNIDGSIYDLKSIFVAILIDFGTTIDKNNNLPTNIPGFPTEGRPQQLCTIWTMCISVFSEIMAFCPHTVIDRNIYFFNDTPIGKFFQLFLVVYKDIFVPNYTDVVRNLIRRIISEGSSVNLIWTTLRENMIKRDLQRYNIHEFRIDYNMVTLQPIEYGGVVYRFDDYLSIASLMVRLLGPINITDTTNRFQLSENLQIIFIPSRNQEIEKERLRKRYVTNIRYLESLNSFLGGNKNFCGPASTLEDCYKYHKDIVEGEEMIIA